MLKNYLKIACRSLAKNKGYSAINIGGLALGMSVAMLIGLWIQDELSYDKYHKNYDRVAQVWQYVTFDVETTAYDVSPIPMADELRSKYPDFEKVSLGKGSQSLLVAGEKKIEMAGKYVEPDFLDMMTVKLLSGTNKALNDPGAILLSESLAKTLFGSQDPMEKVIRIDNKTDVKVAGVYEDFPGNSSLKETTYLVPWSLLISTDKYAKGALQQWDENSWQVYVQLKEGGDFGKASAKIKDIRMKKENPPGYKPQYFLHPMHKWHLYSDFENGQNVGGLITYVWLFGIIGTFVLLLACINFMNLSTARSEKRAKEVGVRKAIGSLRSQLVGQFFSESLLVVFMAFLVAVLLAAAMLPFFNEVAYKTMTMPFFEPVFWLAGLAFCLFTGLIAGSYPALYLSSFKPVTVLKAGSSTFRAGFGKLATLPRKVLVVIQFTVSVTLIIGTIVVFRQIQFAKNRPVGYDRNGLIEVGMNTPELYGKYSVLRQDLLNTGAVREMSESSGSVTVQYGGTTDMSWPGKKPDEHPLIMSNSVSHEYGKTIGWQLVAGRDFSKQFTTDSSAMILNEAAVKLMGLKNPVETIVKRGGKDFKIVGVVKDMIRENPFSPTSPSFFVVNGNVNTINIRLAAGTSLAASLAKVEAVFGKHNPGSPFVYKFVDEEYAKKFGDEARIGKLSSFFAVLAIFISCLGLFGLASFIAEQRTKEIGVRKVLGASVLNLWQLMSKDFVLLVIISCLIACPIAWYLMHGWLATYTLHTEISWWIFAATGLGALAITLLTVSFQAIKAALINPVRSLRSE
ncbi:ABC transporter permease [Dyadobacter sp. CY323]|uniref:ABC transporter permease n=1 Tax=Dyadobacter sp. CY323 TaxID=2907302 RepID=UPI001F2A22F5|nr:ABC transporter permease [Dyadobacter sp. CY323]MCE6992422.1 ABC transporter permease [Dyadobacter sp. CY323]